MSTLPHAHLDHDFPVHFWTIITLLLEISTCSLHLVDLVMGLLIGQVSSMVHFYL